MSNLCQRYMRRHCDERNGGSYMKLLNTLSIDLEEMLSELYEDRNLTRMPAPRKVSAVQLEELVAWMETHPLQARETQLGLPQAKQATNYLWEELASLLNAIGDGVSKTAKEWRQYWSDLKCKVKRKGSVMQKHGSGTGGGPSWGSILTPLEEQILSLMGVQNVLGNANVHIEVDIGLHDSPLPCVPPLTHPRLSPLPSTSDHPTPTVEAEEVCLEPASPPHAGPSQASPSQPRPRRFFRKRVVIQSIILNNFSR